MRVMLLALSGFEMLEFSAFADVLGWAKLEGGHRQKQLAEFGAEVLTDEQIVVDGNLITSCGPSTATGVAFKLLEMLTDRESTQKVMKLMGFDSGLGRNFDSN